MFTGIIQALGNVTALTPLGEDLRIGLYGGTLDMTDVQVGDSIAVNGVCLTVVAQNGANFAADVSRETLSRTTFHEAEVGMAVNLEKALTLATPLSGHLVSGHVDGIGIVLERREEGRSVRFCIEAPTPLARYIAEKGSICVDGISLTVNGVKGPVFDVNIVPHTLTATTMGGFTLGRRVNLEVDIIARYLERLLQTGNGA